MFFCGANVDGARGKWGSIVKASKDSRADILMRQVLEGVMKKPHGFITYEHQRSGFGGG